MNNESETNSEEVLEPFANKTYKRYFDNVLLAASQILPEETKLEVGDVFLVPFVLQHIEMIFSRFDVNQDGLIDRSESELAFPVFKGILLEVLSKKDIKLNDDGLKDFFKFLLYKGKIPHKDDDLIKYWLEFKVGRFFNKKWNVRADRMNVSQILADLARQVRTTGIMSKTLKKLVSD
ncbi:MAG TPA: hypothetical protein PLJ21_03290 [Pseudobdellovibrionaceae bacterium]|nr:hypothetical protein [Pseudobdellovibrionaceae bacterium]